MRNLVLIVLFVAFLAQGFAQVTPQWMTSFYFETADGQKDTVYIGYDSLASSSPDVIDTIFGNIESFVPFNSEEFNAYVPYYYIAQDSIRKISIVDNIDLSSTIINFVGTGDYPITMKWDSDSYYSPDLPADFVEIPNRPNARLDIYPEGFGCAPSCWDNCFFICTDSIYPEIHEFASFDMLEIFADSVVFYCNDGAPIHALNIMIKISPFDSDQPWWPGADKMPYSLNDQVEIFPNPASEFIKIQNASELEAVYVYNPRGVLVLMNNLNPNKANHELDVSCLTPGNYYMLGRGKEGVVFADELIVY